MSKNHTNKQNTFKVVIPLGHKPIMLAQRKSKYKRHGSPTLLKRVQAWGKYILYFIVQFLVLKRVILVYPTQVKLSLLSRCWFILCCWLSHSFSWRKLKDCLQNDREESNMCLIYWWVQTPAEKCDNLSESQTHQFPQDRSLNFQTHLQFND